jgi:hypothetical protein
MSKVIETVYEVGNGIAELDAENFPFLEPICISQLFHDFPVGLQKLG